MLELMEHRAATGELDVIVTLPHDRSKWFELFSSLCKEREEMYSPEKMINVYENYVELYDFAKKVRSMAESMYAGFGGAIIEQNYNYNEFISNNCLFKNIEGQFKGQILKINE